MTVIAIWEVEEAATCQNLRMGPFMETGPLKRCLGKHGLSKGGAVTQYNCHPWMNRNPDSEPYQEKTGRKQPSRYEGTGSRRPSRVKGQEGGGCHGAKEKERGGCHGVKAQERDSCLQVLERGLERNQPCWYLISMSSLPNYKEINTWF